MPANDPPFTAFRFDVTLDLDIATPGFTGPLCDAAFAECEGLEMTMQPRTVVVGGLNDGQVHLVGPVTHGQLTLRRGMTGNLQLWQWFTRGTRPGSVRTAHGTITLRSADGTPTLRFTLTRCLPVRMRAPALHARDGLIAVEELGLVYEHLDIALPDDTTPSAAPGAPATASLGGGSL